MMTFLAIAGCQDMLFGFGKAGRSGTAAPYWRDRKYQRPLQQKQHGKIAEIAHQSQNEEPFQNGHGFLSTVSHGFDDILGHLLGVAEQHHGVVAVEQGIVDAGIT